MALVYVATVRVFELATVVSPLRPTVPVPVRNWPVPVLSISKSLLIATDVSPLIVTCPVPVLIVEPVPSKSSF